VIATSVKRKKRKNKSYFVLMDRVLRMNQKTISNRNTKSTDTHVIDKRGERDRRVEDEGELLFFAD
jgi:hypothetical protein